MESKNPGLGNTLNNGTPTSPNEIITMLEKNFPLDTVEMYPKIGFLVFLLYEIMMQRNSFSDTERSLDEMYKSILANLPKTKEETIKYLSDRFPLEIPDDYYNLYLYLNMLKVLKYDNMIDSYFQAKAFILDRMKIGSPEYNIRGVIERLTRLVQEAALKNFAEMTKELPELEARVQQLKSQEAELAERVAALKRLDTQLEQNIQDFSRKCTQVEWKKVDDVTEHPLFITNSYWGTKIPSKTVAGYYKYLIDEYSSMMQVNTDIAESVIATRCPQLVHGTVRIGDLVHLPVPVYSTPTFDLNNVISSIINSGGVDSHPNSGMLSVSENSSPQELMDMVIQLMKIARQKIGSETELPAQLQEEKTGEVKPGKTM